LKFEGNRGLRLGPFPREWFVPEKIAAKLKKTVIPLFPKSIWSEFLKIFGKTKQTRIFFSTDKHQKRRIQVFSGKLAGRGGGTSSSGEDDGSNDTPEKEKPKEGSSKEEGSSKDGTSKDGESKEGDSKEGDSKDGTSPKAAGGTSGNKKEPFPKVPNVNAVQAFIVVEFEDEEVLTKGEKIT
jgi:hypothetical protein